MNSRRRLHLQLWFPGIGEFRGGIQVYGEHFIHEISAHPEDYSFDLFLRNNKHKPGTLSKYHRCIRVFGWLPDPLRVLWFCLTIFLATLSKRPDLIVVGHINFLPLACMLHRLFGTPLWVLTYGLEAWQLNQRQVQSLGAASRIISISSYTRSRLLEHDERFEETLSILPCVVDTTKFKPGGRPPHLLERHNLSPDNKIIMTVARLEGPLRRKGHEQLISAVRLLRNTHPELRYLIVGTGPDRNRLEALAEGLEDAIIFCGFVADDELCEYYNLCDLYAMPSDMEGFGITFIEALSCGKPVIGAVKSGAEDLVTSAFIGTLVDASDTDVITTSITALLAETTSENAERNARLRHTYVDQNFSPAAFQKKLHALLDEAARIS